MITYLNTIFHRTTHGPKQSETTFYSSINRPQAVSPEKVLKGSTAHGLSIKMTTNLATNFPNPRAMLPQTEARLTNLEDDTTHLRQLDGPGAMAYLNAMSKAMECGPYAGSEATALTDIQGMLLELDIEKAALRLGLFDDYIAEMERAREACRAMEEACEMERAEVGRLREELEEVREELRSKKEDAEGENGVTSGKRGDGEREFGKADDLEEFMNSLRVDDDA